MKIIALSLLGLCFSQDSITTNEYKIYKNNDMTMFDFSNLINDSEGVLYIKLINIEDLHFNKTRKNLYEACPLKVTLSSDFNYKTMEINLCSGLFDISNDLKIDKENYLININSEKYDLLTGNFVFWITGDFKTVNNDTGIIDKKYNGVLREWNKNGDLFIEYNYKNEKRHGVQKKWYDSGQIAIIYNFYKGKLHGEQKSWHQNGKMKSQISYKYDILHGLSKQWNSTGEIISIKDYIDGVLNESKIDKS